MMNTLKECRAKTFTVGVMRTSLHGESMDYPLIVYYPALKEGSDSTPDGLHAPYPGLVFAHGYMATSQLHSHIGKILGSHGFVTAIFSANTRGIDERSWKIFNEFNSTDKKVSSRLPLSSINPLKEIARNREAIAKTINYLSSNPMNIVQTDKIGIVGHSLGGLTSLQAASQDKRVKAVVACSAVNIKMIVEKIGGIAGNIAEKMMGNSEFAAKIKVPTLFINGTQDKITPLEHGLSYYRMISDTPKEILSINVPVDSWDKLGLKAHILGLIQSKKLGDEHTLEIVVKYLVSWFNFFLYEDRRSWRYLFGEEARDDLTKKVLSQLEMENIPNFSQ